MNNKLFILIFLILIALTCISVKAKAQYSDAFMVYNSLVMKGCDVDDDKNLHFVIGYAGTKAISKIIINNTNIKPLYASLIASSMCTCELIKELADRRFERQDVLFTGIGITFAAISINLNL